MKTGFAHQSICPLCSLALSALQSIVFHSAAVRAPEHLNMLSKQQHACSITLQGLHNVWRILSRAHNLNRLRLLSNYRTAVQGLYCVGDSTFPGQGVNAGA
eukprot:scaffold85103_cov21-Tisochrysis_lutea.AAC.1